MYVSCANLTFWPEGGSIRKGHNREKVTKIERVHSPGSMKFMAICPISNWTLWPEGGARRNS